MTSLAENREQHIQRFHEQMQAWQQELERVSSVAHSANSYLQGEMNRLVSQLDKNLHQLTQKLVQMAETGDRRVYSALETMESAWGSLKGTIGDLTHRLRERRGEAGELLQEGVEQTRDMVDEGMDQARQAVNQGRQAVREAVERGTEQARDLMEKGKETLREGAAQVAGQANQAGGKRGQASQATGGIQPEQNTASRQRNQH